MRLFVRDPGIVPIAHNNAAYLAANGMVYRLSRGARIKDPELIRAVHETHRRRLAAIEALAPKSEDAA